MYHALSLVKLILNTNILLNSSFSAVLFWLPLFFAHDAKASSKWIADDEKRLVHFLFENYSNVIRPVEKKKYPVPVKMGIALAQIIDLVRFSFVNNKLFIRAHNTAGMVVASPVSRLLWCGRSQKQALATPHQKYENTDNY